MLLYFSAWHCLYVFLQRPSHRVNKLLGSKLPSPRKVIGCLMPLGLLRNSVISICFHFLQVPFKASTEHSEPTNQPWLSFFHLAAPNTNRSLVPNAFWCLSPCYCGAQQNVLFTSTACSTIFSHQTKVILLEKQTIIIEKQWIQTAVKVIPKKKIMQRGAVRVWNIATGSSIT